MHREASACDMCAEFPLANLFQMVRPRGSVGEEYRSEWTAEGMLPWEASVETPPHRYGGKP